MNNTNSDAFGSLDVSVESDSNYFRYSVPLEIRDQKMRLVRKANGDQNISLPPGLYLVSAVLEDGQEHQEMVRIQSGETSNVSLGANNEGAKQREAKRRLKLKEQLYVSMSKTKGNSRKGDASSVGKGKGGHDRKKKAINKIRASSATKRKRIASAMVRPKKIPRYTKTIESLESTNVAPRLAQSRRLLSEDASHSEEMVHVSSLHDDPAKEPLIAATQEDKTKKSIAQETASIDIVESSLESDPQISGSEAEQTEEPDDLETADQVGRLLNLSNAEQIEPSSSPWRVDYSGEERTVATASIAWANRVYTISLPSSLGGNSSVITMEETYAGVRPVAWIAPHRTVANAIQNMMTANELYSAKEIAQEATELLRSKYQDPAGAALGALLMFKFGLLADRISWLRNLAEDFDWIPDGKILLAATIVKHSKNDAAQMGHAFSLAITASKQRIMYTESFSILLDILRRWPRAALENLDNGEQARMQAISTLGKQSPYIDWNSICLCTFESSN